MSGEVFELLNREDFYHFGFGKAHQPVAQIVKILQSFSHVALQISEINPGNRRLIVRFTEIILVIKQSQFFHDIVHDEKWVDPRPVLDLFSLYFTQIHHLLNIKPLLRIHSDHVINEHSQILRIQSLVDGRVFALIYTFE